MHLQFTFMSLKYTRTNAHYTISKTNLYTKIHLNWSNSKDHRSFPCANKSRKHAFPGMHCFHLRHARLSISTESGTENNTSYGRKHLLTVSRASQYNRITVSFLHREHNYALRFERNILLGLICNAKAVRRFRWSRIHLEARLHAPTDLLTFNNNTYMCCLW